MVLSFCGSLDFHRYSRLQHPRVQHLQAVSMQPILVLFLDMSSKSLFQHPAPACTSRHMSQAGTWTAVAQTLWVGLSLCPAYHKPVVALSSEPLKFLFSPYWYPQWGASQGVGTSPLLQLCPKNTGLILLFFFFLSLFLVLISYVETFLVLSGVWSPLLVFWGCSVKTVKFVDVLLMHLWEVVWHHTTSSSWLQSTHCSSLRCYKNTSSDHPFELPIIEFLFCGHVLHVLINCLFFTCYSIFTCLVCRVPASEPREMEKKLFFPLPTIYWAIF